MTRITIGLILAAGRGSRIVATTKCKPLLSIMGLPLLERTIATAQQAGVTEFCVVTGYDAEKIEDFLLEVSDRRRVPIRVIRNHEWQEGNGSSLLKARDVIDGEFVLLMADHIVDQGVVERVIERGLQGDTVVLAADSRIGPSPWVDSLEATRLRTNGDRIIEIGKGLETYDSYDTGVFLCSQEFFEAADESRKGGDASVTGAVRQSARLGRAKVVDIQGLAWIDVDTRRDADLAKALLLKSIVKSRDGWVSRVLNRPVSSRILTPLLLGLFPRITPNQVSLLSFFVAVIAAAAFTLGQPLAGGLSLHLASILDGSDGEVARLKRLDSRFGSFFDAVLDRYADSIVLFAMLYFAWTAEPNVTLFGDSWNFIVLLVGGIAISGNWMVSYTSAKAATDLDYEYRGSWIGAGRGRDFRLLLLAVSGVLALVHPVSIFVGLAALALLTNGIVLKRVALSWAASKAPSELADIDMVIYDFDGTLADSMPFLTQQAVELITSHYGLSRERALALYLSTSGEVFARQIEELFPDHPANPAVAEAFEKRKREGLPQCKVFPDVRSALELWHRHGVTQFVCSSTREDLVGAFLADQGILPLLDGYVGYHDAFDKGSQIEYVVRAYGFPPNRVLFVGDSIRDADFARKAGVRFLGIEGTFAKRDFASRGLASLSDLNTLAKLRQRVVSFAIALEPREPSGGRRHRQGAPLPRQPLAEPPA